MHTSWQSVTKPDTIPSSTADLFARQLCFVEAAIAQGRTLGRQWVVVSLKDLRRVSLCKVCVGRDGLGTGSEEEGCSTPYRDSEGDRDWDFMCMGDIIHLGSMKGESRIPYALCPPEVPAPGSSTLLCCHTSAMPGITLLPTAVPKCNLSLPQGRAGTCPLPPRTL